MKHTYSFSTWSNSKPPIAIREKKLSLIITRFDNLPHEKHPFHIGDLHLLWLWGNMTLPAPSMHYSTGFAYRMTLTLFCSSHTLELHKGDSKAFPRSQSHQVWRETSYCVIFPLCFLCIIMKIHPKDQTSSIHHVSSLLLHIISRALTIYFLD